MHKDNYMLPIDALNQRYELVFFSKREGAGCRLIDRYGHQCAYWQHTPSYGEVLEKWEEIQLELMSNCIH